MRTAVVVLCLVSTCSAVPLDFLGGLLGRTNSQATGGASGNVVTGTSGGPGQSSQIVQVSAQAGGSTSGNAVSTNSASASHASSSGIFGGQQQSNTNAVSNQQTFDQGLFGGGFQQPNYQPNYQPYQSHYQPQHRPQYRPQRYPNRRLF